MAILALALTACSPSPQQVEQEPVATSIAADCALVTDELADMLQDLQAVGSEAAVSPRALVEVLGTLALALEDLAERVTDPELKSAVLEAAVANEALVDVDYDNPNTDEVTEGMESSRLAFVKIRQICAVAP